MGLWQTIIKPNKCLKLHGSCCGMTSQKDGFKRSTDMYERMNEELVWKVTGWALRLFEVQ
jgi:hypothetical protein